MASLDKLREVLPQTPEQALHQGAKFLPVPLLLNATWEYYQGQPVNATINCLAAIFFNILHEATKDGGNRASLGKLENATFLCKIAAAPFAMAGTYALFSGALLHAVLYYGGAAAILYGANALNDFGQRHVELIRNVHRD